MYKSTEFPPNNGAVLTIAKITKEIMSSTAEAELGALFISFKESIPVIQSLEEMGNTQPPTPMQTENTTARGIVTNIISRKRLNSMYMRLNWLSCRTTQGHFRHYWRSGATNLGYYATKHHAAIHHRTILPIYLTPKSKLDLLIKIVTPRGSLTEE